MRKGAIELVTIAFIPARGGSKTLPRKNLAEIGGVSLVGRAVRLAQSVDAIDVVVVSSDDEEVLDEARSHGATADTRPAGLARDDTPTLEVAREYLARDPSVETVVVLQPTSPLRAAEDVRACLARLTDATSAVTVTAVEHPPEWTFRLGAGDRLEPLHGWGAVVDRRQDAAATFRLNGAVYAVKAARLRAGHGILGHETVAVVMPRERSIDIDDELDLALARMVFRR